MCWFVRSLAVIWCQAFPQRPEYRLSFFLLFSEAGNLLFDFGDFPKDDCAIGSLHSQIQRHSNFPWITGLSLFSKGLVVFQSLCWRHKKWLE